MSYKCAKCGCGWSDGTRPCCMCLTGIANRVYVDDGNGFVVENKFWRTVKLGLHKNADEYRRALKAAGFHINKEADDILGRITFSSVEKEVSLVVYSVDELRFAIGATFAQICTNAKKLGLSLCPAEVGPALREQYRNQPMNEWLVTAMEPMTASGGRLGVFRVGRRDDGLWLNSFYGRPGLVWDADLRFVFVSSK